MSTRFSQHNATQFEYHRPTLDQPGYPQSSFNHGPYEYKPYSENSANMQNLNPWSSFSDSEINLSAYGQHLTQSAQASQALLSTDDRMHDQNYMRNSSLDGHLRPPTDVNITYSSPKAHPHILNSNLNRKPLTGFDQSYVDIEAPFTEDENALLESDETVFGKGEGNCSISGSHAQNSC
jgi:hypothetical protein